MLIFCDVTKNLNQLSLEMHYLKNSKKILKILITQCSHCRENLITLRMIPLVNELSKQ